MMIIKILASQVPTFWEAVKFAAIQADEVDEKNRQAYLNDLLHALLSDKAQCFVELDDSRMLSALIVTRMSADKVTEQKYMNVQTLYAWKVMKNETWQAGMDVIEQFAKKEGCKYISFMSRNPAVWRRVAIMGFTERTRIYSKEV